MLTTPASLSPLRSADASARQTMATLLEPSYSRPHPRPHPQHQTLHHPPTMPRAQYATQKYKPLPEAEMFDKTSRPGFYHRRPSPRHADFKFPSLAGLGARLKGNRSAVLFALGAAGVGVWLVDVPGA